MRAILNVYKDCETEEPTKTYTCHRLLLGVSKKVESLSNQLDKTNDEKEQEKITVQILKTILPSFDEADLDYIDPTEYMEFVRQISVEGNRITEQARKN